MNYINQVKKLIIDAVLSICSFFIKRSKKKIVLGAWVGQLYADNSKYLLESMIVNLDDSYTFVWIGDESLRNVLPRDSRIILLEKNSYASIKELLTCQYFFCSQFAEIDICSYNVYRNATVTYLHHGFPIKKIGKDKIGHKSVRNNLLSAALKKLSLLKYSYFAVSSSVQKQIFLSAFNNRGCSEKSIIPCGTPRNDFLVNLTTGDCAALKSILRKKYNISESAKIIVYLPTFRRSGTSVPSLYLSRSKNENSEIRKILEEFDGFLIEKRHFADCSERWRNNCDRDYRYLCLTENVNTQELLACTDILISDYSGAFVDFLLLDRPIIHYIYDYDFYRLEDSGLYFTVDEFSCGEVAYNYNEFLKSLRLILSGIDKFRSLRKEKRSMFLEYERGIASKLIIEQIVKP